MVIVILLAVGLLIMSTTVFIGIDELEVGFAQQASGTALLAAGSCAEEAMLRLSRDNGYTGGSLTVGESICTITVTGAPCGACIIEAESVSGDFTRNIAVGVSVSGSTVDITSWEEE